MQLQVRQMSDKKKAILYIPLIWIFAGLMWLPQGNKPLVVIMLICSVFLFIKEKLEGLRNKVNNDMWLKLIFFGMFFGCVSYYYYGFSSQELRALIIGGVFFLVYDEKHIKMKDVQYLLFIGAISATVLSLYVVFILHGDRYDLPSNAVPLASHQGFIAISLVSLLFFDFEGKDNRGIVVSTFLTFSSLFITASRGPIVVLAMMLISISILSIFKKGISRKMLAMSVVVISIIFYMGGFLLQDRMLDTIQEIELIRQGYLDTSIGLRIQMLVAGVETFLSNPMFGVGSVGLQNFAGDFFDYTPSAISFITNGHLHNNYIDKLAVSGLVGFFVFSLLLIYPLYKSYYTEGNERLLVILPVTYFILISLFDAPFRNGDTAVLYLVMVGVYMSLVKSKEGM